MLPYYFGIGMNLIVADVDYVDNDLVETEMEILECSIRMLIRTRWLEQQFNKIEVGKEMEKQMDLRRKCDRELAKTWITM